MSLLTNTTKLNELKNKANNLPDRNPPDQLQEKTVTPTKEGLSVAPDSGFDGLSKVTVNGDNNLVPENIKEGTSIFGIMGTHAGEALSLFEYRHSTYNDCFITYTDKSGIQREIPLSAFSDSGTVNDVDFTKEICYETKYGNTRSGYYFYINIENGALSIRVTEKGVAPPF